MPINEEKAAIPLITGIESISRAELQNRQGMRHETINSLTPGKFLTILAVETELALGVETYFSLLGTLKSQFGVLAMQTLFGTEVPAEEGYESDLHISAHLRMRNAEVAQIPEEQPNNGINV